MHGSLCYHPQSHPQTPPSHEEKQSGEPSRISCSFSLLFLLCAFGWSKGLRTTGSKEHRNCLHHNCSDSRPTQQRLTQRREDMMSHRSNNWCVLMTFQGQEPWIQLKEMLHEWSDNRCIHTGFNKADNRGVMTGDFGYSADFSFCQETRVCTHCLFAQWVLLVASILTSQTASLGLKPYAPTVTVSHHDCVPPWLCPRDLVTCIDWFFALRMSCRAY